MRRERVFDNWINETQGKKNLLYNIFQKEIDYMFADHENNIIYGDECLWYIPKRIDNNRDYALEEDFLEMIKDPLPLKESHNIILLSGSTGHGKSTFVEHFFKSYVPKNYPELYNKIVYIRVNMEWVIYKQQEEMEKNADEIVNKELKNLINDTRFRLSIAISNKKDLADQNREIIEALKRKYDLSFIFFYDNADQVHNIVQLECFRLANYKLHWLDKQRCLIILAVRDYFLDKAKTELAQNANNNIRDFRISPAPLSDILQGRIKLAVEEAKKLKTEIKQIALDGKNTLITIGNLENFLLNLFIHFTYKDMTEILESLTGYNIRRQLEIITWLVTSPKLEEKVTDYIRASFQYSKDMNFDPAELVRFVLSPDTNFAYSNKCPIIHAFDFDSIHWSNTLVIYNILSLFHTYESYEITDIKSKLIKLGCSLPIFNEAMQTLLYARYVYSKEGINLDEHKIKTVKITKAGEIFRDKWMLSLYYLEKMAYSTPLESDLKNHLPSNPESIPKKMQGVIILYYQIKRDERREIEYCGQNYLKKFNIGFLSEKIRNSVMIESKKIHSLSNTDKKIFESQFNDEIAEKYIASTMLI
jgi:hypothetical protein